MKSAERQNAWRRVGQDWPTAPRVSHIAAVGMPGVEQGGLELFGGMSLICGINGSGKTRLLNAVSDAIVTGRTDVVQVTSTGTDSSVAFIDTFWLVQRQRISLGRDQSLKDRIDQAGSTDLRPLEVRMISYLLGREFDRVEVAELEATDDDAYLEQLTSNAHSSARALAFRSDVVPYFRVERNGAEYDSLQLSQGELAGLTLLWALRQSTASSLTIIDEPETFLSPLAAMRCLDLVAHYANQNESPTIVASHSYLGLAAAPQQHLILLHPAAPGMVRLQDANEKALWSTLRLAAPKAIVFVVEDEAARQWLQYILHMVKFQYLDLVEIWIAGDSGQVRKAAMFPTGCRGASVTIWGVLDGDERAKSKAKGNLLFLPGQDSPEAVILDYARNCDGDLGGLPKDKVHESLARHEGEDPHDAVLGLADDLGLAVSAFRHLALGAWLNSSGAGSAALDQFTGDLSAVALPDIRL